MAPRPLDLDYAQRTICISFAEGLCTRPDCRFSHTLVDPARLLRLVGDVRAESQRGAPRDRVCLSMAYGLSHDAAGTAVWEVDLTDGGRATLAGDGWEVSTQPSYPLEANGTSLAKALNELEVKVFGRSAPVSSGEFCGDLI